MTEITIDNNTFQMIALFERITGAMVKDCLDTPEVVHFVVRKGDISKAVGKKGENIVRLKKMMNKSIVVIEYDEDPERFIKNVFYAYKPTGVEIEQRGSVVHATVTVDPKLKAKAIGKGGSNLKRLRNIISRHHEIQSVSVA